MARFFGLLAVCSLLVSMLATSPFTALAVENTEAPETMVFDLMKKFSGEVPVGYTADQFTFTITGAGISDTEVSLTEVTSDTAVGTVDLPVGTYTITENGPLGFVPSEWTVQWSGAGCDNQQADATTITIDESDLDKTNFGCRADNQWRYGSLTVEKIVEGTTTPYENFSFTVTQGERTLHEGSFDTDGSISVLIGAGAYTVVETDAPGYVTTYSDSCSGDMAQDASVTCTITNTWINDGDVLGCTDPDADNYDEDATIDDGSCTYDGDVYGCTDPEADNYNADATIDDGSCTYGGGGGGGQCVDELQGGWVDSVISNNQGQTKGAGAVIPARSDTSEVLGAADGLFYSLGFGGDIVVKFNKYVPDEDGADISVHEITNGVYPLETARVEVSQNGSEWYEVGTADNTEVGYFDFSGTGLTWIKYVRLTDTTDAGLHNNAADGFDLDAVDATVELCDEPEGGDNGGGDETVYKVYGYVWHDENENDVWEQGEPNPDDNENDLDGWTVEITNGEVTYSTTTDETGYYYFLVPAGTWTVNEVLQSDWTKTYPDVNGHVIEVGDTSPHCNVPALITRVWQLFMPVAHAATIISSTTCGSFDFGNVMNDTTDGGTTPTGGGGNGVRIELSETPDREVAGSSDSRPQGEVLGEQVSVVPVGAPDTGRGGTAPIEFPKTAGAAALSLARRRNG